MKTHLSSCFLLFAVACAGPAPYAALAIENDVEENAAVVITDRTLHAIVRCGRPNLERVPGTNQLRITVPIRNIDDESITVWVQVGFYDGKRAPLGDETSREQRILAPGQTIHYQATSQQETADDFVMRIGWGK